MEHRPTQIHSLFHSSDLLEKRLAKLLSPMGIRPRQARVLNVLNRMGATSQAVLAQEFDVTAGSMSTMIDRLLSLGFISRYKNPSDKRGDIVALTSAGKAILSDIRDAWQDLDDMMVSAIGAEKTTLLVALTKELKFALGGKIPGMSVPRQPFDGSLAEFGWTKEGQP